jgi:hypothetical protein
MKSEDGKMMKDEDDKQDAILQIKKPLTSLETMGHSLWSNPAHWTGLLMRMNLRYKSYHNRHSQPSATHLASDQHFMTTIKLPSRLAPIFVRPFQPYTDVDTLH